MSEIVRKRPNLSEARKYAKRTHGSLGGVGQIGVFIPIARSTHQPFRDSKIANAPPTRHSTVTTHAITVPRGRAHANSKTTPTTSSASPYHSRTSFPRASMLQVRGIPRLYHRATASDDSVRRARWPVAGRRVCYPPLGLQRIGKEL